MATSAAPIQVPITGKELIQEPAAPLYALSQFYRAFNNRDVHLMAENWEHSESASMDNPVGGIKRGWENIRPVYERIFGSNATVQVEFFDYTIHEARQLFYAVGASVGILLREESRWSCRFARRAFFDSRAGSGGKCTTTDRWMIRSCSRRTRRRYVEHSLRKRPAYQG